MTTITESGYYRTFPDHRGNNYLYRMTFRENAHGLFRVWTSVFSDEMTFARDLLSNIVSAVKKVEPL